MTNNSETHTVLITGASKGIGKASAALFLSKGMRVINLSRSKCALNGVENIKADLMAEDWSAVESSLKARLSDERRPIVLVHNAAIFDGGSTLEDCSNAMRRSYELNVVAPLRLNALVRPLMTRSSSIIYIGSTLSEKAVSGIAPYVASKHGMAGLMKSTTQDLGNSGIHTAMVCPGFTDTEMLRHNIPSSEVLESIKSNQLMGRLITPGEIAEAIYSVATQPVFNGSLIHANLGQVEH